MWEACGQVKKGNIVEIKTKHIGTRTGKYTGEDSTWIHLEMHDGKKLKIPKSDVDFFESKRIGVSVSIDQGTVVKLRTKGKSEVVGTFDGETELMIFIKDGKGNVRSIPKTNVDYSTLKQHGVSASIKKGSYVEIYTPGGTRHVGKYDGETDKLIYLLDKNGKRLPPLPKQNADLKTIRQYGVSSDVKKGTHIDFRSKNGQIRFRGKYDGETDEIIYLLDKNGERKSIPKRSADLKTIRQYGVSSDVKKGSKIELTTKGKKKYVGTYEGEDTTHIIIKDKDGTHRIAKDNTNFKTVKTESTKGKTSTTDELAQARKKATSKSEPEICTISTGMATGLDPNLMNWVGQAACGCNCPTSTAKSTPSKKVETESLYDGYSYDAANNAYVKKSRIWFDDVVEKGDPKFSSLESKRLKEKARTSESDIMASTPRAKGVGEADTLAVTPGAKKKVGEADTVASIPGARKSVGEADTLAVTPGAKKKVGEADTVASTPGARVVSDADTLAATPQAKIPIATGKIKATQERIVLLSSSGAKYRTTVLDFNGNKYFFDLEEGWVKMVGFEKRPVISEQLIKKLEGSIDLTQTKLIEKGEVINLRSVYTPKKTTGSLVGSEIVLPDGSKKNVGYHIGKGTFGDVYCLEIVPPCKQVIKFPYLQKGVSNADSRRIFQEEIAITNQLDEAGVRVAKIRSSEGGVLIKDFVEGDTLWDLKATGRRLSSEQLSGLEIFWKSVRKEGIHMDATISNLKWLEKEKKWVIFDAGPRGHPGNDWQIRLNWLPPAEYEKIVKNILGQTPKTAARQIPVTQAELDKVLDLLKAARSKKPIPKSLENILEGVSPLAASQYHVVANLERKTSNLEKILFDEVEKILRETTRISSKSAAKSEDIGTAIKNYKAYYAVGDFTRGDTELARAYLLADRKSLFLGKELRAKHNSLSKIDELAREVKVSTRGNQRIYNLKGKEFVYDSKKGWIRPGVDSDLAYVLKKEEDILTTARNQVKLEELLKAEKTPKKRTVSDVSCELPLPVARAIHGLACGSVAETASTAAKKTSTAVEGPIDLRQTYTPPGTTGQLAGRKIVLPDGSTQTLGKYLGSGHFGEVYCLDNTCKKIIKLPHGKHKSLEETILTFKEEVANSDALERSGRRVAKIEAGPNHNYLIKEYVEGTPLSEMNKITGEQAKDLEDLLVQARKSNIELDGNMDNYFWSAKEKKFILIDTGSRSSVGTDWKLWFNEKLGSQAVDHLISQVYTGSRKVLPKKSGIVLSQQDYNKFISTLDEAIKNRRYDTAEVLLGHISPELLREFRVNQRLFGSVSDSSSKLLFQELKLLIGGSVDIKPVVKGQKTNLDEVSKAINEYRYLERNGLDSTESYKKAVALADQYSPGMGKKIPTSYPLTKQAELAANVKITTKGDKTIYTLAGKDFVYDGEKWVRDGFFARMFGGKANEKGIAALDAAREKAKLQQKLKGVKTPAVKKPVVQPKAKGCDIRLPAPLPQAIYGLACGSVAETAAKSGTVSKVKSSTPAKVLPFDQTKIRTPESVVTSVTNSQLSVFLGTSDKKVRTGLSYRAQLIENGDLDEARLLDFSLFDIEVKRLGKGDVKKGRELLKKKAATLPEGDLKKLINEYLRTQGDVKKDTIYQALVRKTEIKTTVTKKVGTKADETIPITDDMIIKPTAKPPPLPADALKLPTPKRTAETVALKTKDGVKYDATVYNIEGTKYYFDKDKGWQKKYFFGGLDVDEVGVKKRLAAARKTSTKPLAPKRTTETVALKTKEGVNYDAAIYDIEGKKYYFDKDKGWQQKYFFGGLDVDEVGLKGRLNEARINSIVVPKRPVVSTADEVIPVTESMIIKPTPKPTAKPPPIPEDTLKKADEVIPVTESMIIKPTPKPTAKPPPIPEDAKAAAKPTATKKTDETISVTDEMILETTPTKSTVAEKPAAVPPPTPKPTPKPAAKPAVKADEAAVSTSRKDVQITESHTGSDGKEYTYDVLKGKWTDENIPAAIKKELDAVRAKSAAKLEEVISATKPAPKKVQTRTATDTSASQATPRKRTPNDANPGLTIQQLDGEYYILDDGKWKWEQYVDGELMDVSPELSKALNLQRKSQSIRLKTKIADPVADTVDTVRKSKRYEGSPIYKIGGDKYYLGKDGKTWYKKGLIGFLDKKVDDDFQAVLDYAHLRQSGKIPKPTDLSDIVVQTKAMQGYSGSPVDIRVYQMDGRQYILFPDNYKLLNPNQGEWGGPGWYAYDPDVKLYQIRHIDQYPDFKSTKLRLERFRANEAAKPKGKKPVVRGVAPAPIVVESPIRLPSKTADRLRSTPAAAPVENIRSGKQGVVAVGDLHGSYDNLFDDINRQITAFDSSSTQRILTGNRNDPTTWKWAGGDATIVQVGDIYDRGEFGSLLRTTFNRLDDEAKKSGGRVIRLMGNHELFFIEEGRNIINYADQKEVANFAARYAKKHGVQLDEFEARLKYIAEVKKGILEDIAAGRLHASAAVDGELFTHAGVSLRKFPNWKGKTASEISADINSRFKKAVKSYQESGNYKTAFNDPIFDIGKSRGGKADQGGIFWLDSVEIRKSSDWDLGFKQIRGHEADVSTKTKGIRTERTENVITVDVGRTQSYGGGKGAYYNKRPAQAKKPAVQPKAKGCELPASVARAVYGLACGSAVKKTSTDRVYQARNAAVVINEKGDDYVFELAGRGFVYDANKGWVRDGFFARMFGGKASPKGIKELNKARKEVRISRTTFTLDKKKYVYDAKTRSWKQKRWWWTDKKITNKDAEFSKLEKQKRQEIFTNFQYEGDEVMGAMAQEYPELRALFAADAGVGEGYTIQQHTKMVFDLFEQHRSILATVQSPKGVDLERLFPAMLALHDIGKPEAIAKGTKHLQHQYTLPILEKTLKKMGFGQAEIDLAKNLVRHDTLGDLATGRISTIDAFEKLNSLAKSSGMEADEFLKLQQLFFTSDAASYAFVRQQSFVQKGNLLVPKSKDFETLRKMMEMRGVDDFSKMTGTQLHSWVAQPLVRKSILGSSTKTREIGHVPGCCHEKIAFEIPESLKADTLPGAIDKIRQAQQASIDTKLGKAYHQIRSSNPQTFSQKSLEEIIENLDTMLDNNFVHGTSYRTLPGLKRAKQTIGSPALLPTGALKEAGLAAGGGELGIGVVGESALNIRKLSGVNYFDSNLDTTYHYSRLRGGYDIGESQERISKLEKLLKQYQGAGTKSGEIRSQIMGTLYNDFEIFDTRLLMDRQIETAKSTIQREKTFLQQATGYSPLEIRLIKEGKPIIITDDRIVTPLAGQIGSIRGEITVTGRVDLNNPAVGVFVERAEIPEIRAYMQTELGVNNPNLISIESYDLLNSILDSYRMEIGGKKLSPEQLRLELKNDPDGLRVWLKQQLKNYVAAMN